MRKEATGVGMRKEGASEMRDVKREMQDANKQREMQDVNKQ